ncbi:MAG: sulfite exporter TauE/SafE family protein [Chloroflexi bacterium]|nr:sulfite exporter TauE/SafE family protein [Chloroflexota bacterium]
MDQSVNLAVAFGAGVASFIAPCTLALVPAYVLYLGGLTLSDGDAAGARATRGATLRSVLAFTVGFTSVFVILGASLGALTQTLADHSVWLNRVGGTLIILLGLMALGLLRVPLAQRGFAFRPQVSSQLHVAGAFLVGGTFAVSWVPCVGPILGAILVLAATTASVGEGALLLLAYSLGMMLPFAAAGAFSGWTRALLQRHGQALGYATHAGGILLIALGIVVFTNLMPVIARYIPIGV